MRQFCVLHWEEIITKTPESRQVLYSTEFVIFLPIPKTIAQISGTNLKKDPIILQINGCPNNLCFPTISWTFNSILVYSLCLGPAQAIDRSTGDKKTGTKIDRQTEKVLKKGLTGLHGACTNCLPLNGLPNKPPTAGDTKNQTLCHHPIWRLV